MQQKLTIKFCDLKSLPYDKEKGTISVQTLKDSGIEAPDEILKQLYSDHGIKSDFQQQYSSIYLNKITWTKLSFSANEIINCTYCQEFQTWFNSVVSRIEDFGTLDWECIDARQAIQNYWRNTKTWIEPPIFINGKLIQKNNKLHLVEGHTRVGILRGLVNHNIISDTSNHIVWYGDYS